MKHNGRSAFEDFAASLAPDRGPVLMVADSGGHLQELGCLDRVIGPDVRRVWVSSDTEMSRSLLRSKSDVRLQKERIFPRRLDLALRSIPSVLKTLRELRPQAVLSTGPAIAVPWLVSARLLSLPAVFVESATFVTRRSLSGRLLELAPGVRRFSQTGLCAGGWGDAPNVFDLIERRERRSRREPGPLRLFVTVGSNRYAFDRLIRRLDHWVPAEWQITWQLSGGAASYHPRRGRVAELFSFQETQDLLSRSDVVICHAGVGSAISALAHGKRPILVPRSRAHGEHIDDHQHDLASALRSSPHVLVREPEAISMTDLMIAARLG